MGINVKAKGTRWELDLSKLLTEKIPGSTWKRMPTSGAMGTILEMPELGADLRGKIPGIEPEWRVEAKVGYSRKGAEGKSMTIQREWIEGIIEEAKKTYSIPMLVCKFSGVRTKGSVREYVVLDIDTFADLCNQLSEQAEEIGRLHDSA